LTPSSKKQQFLVTSPHIIILPMLMNPPSATIAPLGTQTFQALGGYGAITYTLSVNNSGGSINSSTGAYTAGSTRNVQDTVLATDTQSHTVTAIVQVT
jgi:pectate lyase